MLKSQIIACISEGVFRILAKDFGATEMFVKANVRGQPDILQTRGEACDIFFTGIQFLQEIFAVSGKFPLSCALY